MIKIDLLPQDLKNEEGARKQKYWTIVGGVLLLVLIGSYWGYENYVFTSKQKELQNTKDELEKVSALVNAVEQIKQQKEVLERKWGVVETLLEGRFKWAMILDEVSKCIPNSIWLTNLTSTKTESGNILSITGMAFDNFAIADFITTLEDDNYFEKVELGSITEASSGDKNAKATLNFNLTLNSKL